MKDASTFIAEILLSFPRCPFATAGPSAVAARLGSGRPAELAAGPGPGSLRGSLLVVPVRRSRNNGIAVEAEDSPEDAGLNIHRRLTSPEDFGSRARPLFSPIIIAE
jgi:hypothetical protein